MADILPGNGMKNKVLIIGAGGHAAEIADYIRGNNKAGVSEIEIQGFIDDNEGNYTRYAFREPYLGTICDHKVVAGSAYIIAIANLSYRRFFVEKFLAEGAVFASLIHYSAFISSSSRLGIGVVIGPMANLGPKTVVGDYTLINSRCSLGHDTEIGKFNFISPNVCFSGFSRIGDENLFGINSATIPNITVGNKNQIAAGMVLHQDVTDNETVFYRYKERIIAKPR